MHSEAVGEGDTRRLDIAQKQQGVAVLGEEVVEPQCSAIGVGDPRVGRAVARGGSRHSGAVLLDDWAVPVIDCDPRQAFIQLLLDRGKPGEQRHQVIAHKAGERAMQ